MAKYYFIRSVPVLVGVEADSPNNAFHAAGDRVDDFMSDAMENVPRIAHTVDEEDYVLEYQGDAISAVEGLRLGTFE